MRLYYITMSFTFNILSQSPILILLGHPLPLEFYKVHHCDYKCHTRLVFLYLNMKYVLSLSISPCTEYNQKLVWPIAVSHYVLELLHQFCFLSRLSNFIRCLFIGCMCQKKKKGQTQMDSLVVWCKRKTILRTGQ